MAAISSPNLVGVIARVCATRSATDSSPVWPMPVNTGVDATRDRPRHALVVEAREVALRAAAAHDADDVDARAASRRSIARDDLGRGAVALDEGLHERDRQSRSRELSS